MQDGIQRERKSHRVQLQLREVNFLYAEGCRAALQSHWCSPFLCIGGRAEQGHNSSKFTAAYLQDLLQAEDRRTNSEAYQTPSSTWPDQWAKAPSPFAHYRPAVGSAWKWTKLSSQHLHGTNTGPHHLPGTGDPGAKTLCCVKVAVLLLETALYPKPGSSTVSDTKPKILSRTRCYTCLTPAWRLWGNMVPRCLLHHFGQDQGVSLGFGVKHDSRAHGRPKQPPQHPCCNLQLTGKLTII